MRKLRRELGEEIDEIGLRFQFIVEALPEIEEIQEIGKVQEVFRTELEHLYRLLDEMKDDIKKLLARTERIGK